MAEKPKNPRDKKLPPSKFVDAQKGNNQPVFIEANRNFLSDVNIPVSASVVSVSPRDIVSDSFITLEDTAIIPNSGLSSSFLPNENLVEFYAYDTQKNIISRNYNFLNWGITKNTTNTEVPTTFTDNQGIQILESDTSPIPTDFIELNPATDLYNLGFDAGETYALYNFINYELGSSVEDTYYISEISGDRTEIKLRSNTISDGDIRSTYKKFRQKFNSQKYFDEFYLGLFDNRYEICTNILLERDSKGESLLIKLYNELDPSILAESQVYLITKVGETVSYKVEFEEDYQSFVDNATYIKGPNINIPLQDLVNNSTTLKSQNNLLDSNSSESVNAVLNILNQTGVTITPDYSYNTFDQFVNFSSAKERLNNFIEKVTELQSYQSDISTIENVTGSNPGVVAISSSLASLTTKISNLIENFDGYENYLYYKSSSYAYPKTGSAYPYTLLPTTDQAVIDWIGSDVEGSQYYGGYVLSASLYDENNQNWLYYTIPEFIKENSSNDEYITFSNMVGQSFDEVWLYTKALSERYNTTNDPDKGLPLDLAADAIKGLGFETFGNNYDNQDNFIGLAGEDNGTYVPPTGSELITKYVAINNGQIINYWSVGYSWEDYVEQFIEAGFPYAIDKVSKEIYKRLYHNMAYLTKKKGSISGLRQLINIWGIPNTILRINEFGGKNRDNTDDYDLWQNRYSYAYTPISAGYHLASSSIKVPWMPLERNYIAETENIVPDGVALRFKAPKGAPISTFGGSFYSQSIAVKKSNGTANSQMDWGISLFYEDQPSGSYSGSSFSDYYNYGKLRFYMSASTADGGVQISNDIYLPFFDGGWWSVLLQRDQHIGYTDNTVPTTYTLFAANKQSNGWDGNSIGFTGSVSMNSTTKLSINKSWNDFGVTEVDGVYIGGYISGSNIMSEVSNDFGKIFSGSFQEFRYYSNDIPRTVFNDFVMNPESIEGNNITGSESSFDIVNFRAPLGNELENIFSGSSTTFTDQISSSHPAITGSATVVITGSFRNPADSTITSSYNFIGYNDSKDKIYSKPNTEVYFLDQPSIGIRNRVSKKIKVEDGSVYGKVLSQYKSIDQDYLISQSYTEDITSLEVGFSPQDEVNDDIIASFGYGVISSVIADPRFFYDSQEVYYPKLRQISEEYFKKYTEGSVWDYIRLIKYFDNSLFKAIKSFVPARTSVTTGVIIKQNMLERNRRPSVLINPNTIIAYTPETGSVVGGQSTETGFNSAISYRDLELTGSINIGTLSGLHGNVPPNLRGEVSASGAGFNIIPITQSWTGSYDTVLGLIPFTDSSSYEFYNGEYSGSTIVVTTQSLLNNPFSLAPVLDTNYTVNVTSSEGKFSETLNSTINTYPSFSFNLQAFSYGSLSSDPAGKSTFQGDFDSWGTGNTVGDSTGSIFIAQDDPNSGADWQSRFYIIGLILPQRMRLKNSGVISTNNAGNHLGINYTPGFSGYSAVDDQPYFSLADLITLPSSPTSGSGLIGLETGDYIPNDIGPYFKLDITGSMNSFYANPNNTPVVPTTESVYDENNYPITEWQNNQLPTPGASLITTVSPPGPNTGTKYYSDSFPSTLNQNLRSVQWKRKASLGLIDIEDTDELIYANNFDFAASDLQSPSSFRFTLVNSTNGDRNTTLNLNMTEMQSYNVSNGLADPWSTVTLPLSLFTPSGSSLDSYKYDTVQIQYDIRSNATATPTTESIYDEDNYPTTEWLNNQLPSGANIASTTSPPGPNTGTKYYRDSFASTLFPNLRSVQWKRNPSEGTILIDQADELIYANNFDFAASDLQNGSYFKFALVNSTNGEIYATPELNMTAIQSYNVANLGTSWSTVTLPFNIFTASGSILGDFYYDTLQIQYDILSNSRQGQTVNLDTLRIQFNGGAPPDQTFNLDTLRIQFNGGGVPPTDFPDGVGFDTDDNFGGLDTNEIISRVIGPNTTITRTPGQTGTTNGEGLVKYLIGSPQSNNARPIRLYDKATNNAANIPWNSAQQPFTGSSTSTVFISNYDTEIERQRDAFAVAPQKPNSLPLIGSGSLSLVGTTWTGSYSDHGDWFPSLLLFNRRNYDTLTGDLINNTETFTQFPQFQFTIDGFTGTPYLPPVIFKQSNNDISGLLSYNSGTVTIPFENDAIAYSYIPATSTFLSGSPFTSTPPGMFIPNLASNQYIPFDPQLPLQSDFYNTPFNPLINNATESVKNTYVQVVEYDNGPIPSNFDPIVSRTALKARIPDSFYTQKASILPRYLGSTLQSANYNTYTLPGNITFLNAFFTGSTVTGSTWDGDVSFGKTSVIDVNPIYMAHFKNSKENYELFGSYTFRIDSLIEVPLEDVTGGKAPITPMVLKVDGSNTNLAEVRSSFEVNRSASIAYNSSKFRGVKYSSLKVGSGKIFQGAMEYQTIFTTQPNPTSFINTASFITSSWVDFRFAISESSSTTTANSNVLLLPESNVTPSGTSSSLGEVFSVSSSGAWLSTGSNALYFRGGYTLTIQNMMPNEDAAEGSTAIEAGSGRFYGSSLAMIHNYNKYSENKIVATGSLYSYVQSTNSGISKPGTPSASFFQFDNEEIYSYLEFSGSNDGALPSSSNLLPYEDFNQQFLVKVGDEVRVTYNIAVAPSGTVGRTTALPSVGNPTFHTETFTVVSAEGNTDYENEIYPFEMSASIFTTQISESGGGNIIVNTPITESQYNYDKLIVYPDPSTVQPPIIDGDIFNFTIRRRINADDRVVVYQSPPSGSKGVETISGDGYIIPDDFSSQQKRNALTLINQLTAKNAFRASEDPPSLKE